MKLPRILIDKSEEEIKLHFKMRKNPEGILGKIMSMSGNHYKPDVAIRIGTKDAIKWRSNGFHKNRTAKYAMNHLQGLTLTHA